MGLRGVIGVSSARAAISTSLIGWVDRFEHRGRYRTQNLRRPVREPFPVEAQLGFRAAEAPACAPRQHQYQSGDLHASILVAHAGRRQGLRSQVRVGRGLWTLAHLGVSGDDQRMRIMVVAPPWLPVPPRGYGGTEAVVDSLARGFAAAGHNVLLCATGDSTCPVERRSVYDSGQGFRAGAPVELRHVFHAYEVAGDFDLVHDHTLLGPLLAAQMTDTPVVTTNHGPFDAELQAVYRVIAQRVPVIAVSASQAASAAGIPIAGVIHHGVSVAEFPFGDSPGDYLLFLGRMSPTKGADRAARIARAAGQRLVIAAKMREPEEHRYFEEQVEPLLDDRVVYIGEVGGRDKLELLSGARGLLNPIGWPEPFGLVMIEALACGTPVLAFPNGAAPEIVRHGVTGFLCADEADMVRCLRQVDRLDRAACRASVTASFSVERMVAAHLEFYASLLERTEVAA